MNTAEVRRRFLEFFARRNHVEVPSASLIYNDPTLLFVNAGMVPFKPYFTGAEDAPWDRAVSVQKCVRTLDIDEVGKTTRHGTFFQMCGNFAFADYFKAGAIEFAWELVTGSRAEGNFGFDPATIWVTVLHDDDEAADLWRQIGVPAERIQRRGLNDNYWHMGVPGPGGPCSEIYVDRGPQYGPDGGPIVDEDRFLEIWNLVFQTEELSAVRAKDDFDVLAPLPANNIDTGLGLERTAFLLQGVQNMYEIDEIFPVITRAAELAGIPYGQDHESDVRLRVVGDHVRSALMLITDGVTPGNEARGYVLRRLLRRSVRSMRLLGVGDPVLPELLPVSKNLMERSYPEVASQWQRVSQIAYGEEDAFRRTLAQGSQIFDLAATASVTRAQSTLSGDTAFQLHDTYGFPIDLTLEMAAERGLSVDRDAFGTLMQQQKDRAKADARSKRGVTANPEAYRALRSAGETPFRGFTDLTVPSRVRGIINAGQLVEVAQPGDVVEVVLDETPFYAEAGGQDADSGTITGSGIALDVLDVQRPIQGLVVHKAMVTEGELAAGAQVEGRVDSEARFAGSQAHTSTHLVNAALRQLLGQGTHQAGSYNKPGYLRFDFNASSGLSPALRSELEDVVNTAIRDDFEVTAQELPLAQAKALGAQAMFGEKYGDVVRMVELAGPWSRELCGGTHVARTSQIGLVSLIGEQSVGSGIRRVEALVSRDAFAKFAAERALVAGLAEALKTQPDRLAERVDGLLAQLKAAEKQIDQYRSKELLANASALLQQATTVGPVQLVAQQLPGVAGADLRTMAVDLRAGLGSQAAVVALVGGSGDKPVIAVATNEAARAAGAKAGQLVRVAAEQLGGRGGGKDDFAQGGGSNGAGAQAALDQVRSALIALAQEGS